MNRSLMTQLQDFRRLSGGFRATRVILTANNYKVFEFLQTPKTASEIAREIKTSGRATEILLDAVTALGLLRKAAGKYRNTSVAARFLLKDSPWYQGDMLRHMDALWKSWSGLDEVVRTGLPNRAGGRDHEAFIRAMHNNAVFRAKEVVEAIGMRGVKKALDLGGGPGTYSMEMARKNVAVTLFDLPNTLAVSRKIVQAAKVGNINFRGGDFHGDDIGSGYDLVFVSQILHSLSEHESIELLMKARFALNPKGKVAIQEFLLNENKASPVPGALFSINMLVNTSAGRCYTPQEIKAWLMKAGFRKIKTKALGETVVLCGEAS